MPLPGGREVELARIRLGVGNELLHGVGRHRRIDDEHIGDARDEDHRDEVLDVVVRHLRIQARIDRVRADRAHFERVAVGRRLGDEFRADVAARARPIVDDDALAPGFGEVLRDLAGENVGGAARRKRHDEADRLRRIGGGLCAWQSRATRTPRCPRSASNAWCIDVFMPTPPVAIRSATSIDFRAGNLDDPRVLRNFALDEGCELLRRRRCRLRALRGKPLAHVG